MFNRVTISKKEYELLKAKSKLYEEVMKFMREITDRLAKDNIEYFGKEEYDRLNKLSNQEIESEIQKEKSVNDKTPKE